VLAALVLAFVVSRMAAGPAPAPSDVFECRWAESPVTLDGKPDEAAWRAAQVIDHFYLPWLGAEARSARSATKARLLWDREYLYFAADMEGGHSRADATAHDAWDEDAFGLLLKPADDKPGFYEFRANAASSFGGLFLARRGAGGQLSFQDGGEFHGAAKVCLPGTLNGDRKKGGWSLEGRVPWSDLLRTGGRPEPGERWKFALVRCDRSANAGGTELSACAPFREKPPAGFHATEDFVTLQFVSPGASVAGKPFGIARRTPLTTSRVAGSPDPPPPYRVHRVYPKLAVSFPICVVRQPGSDRLIAVAETVPYGPTSLVRFRDDSGVESLEKLFDVDGVAYDVKFHPKFAENGFFYVGSNGPEHGGPKSTRVTRYTMGREPPYTVDPKSAKLIIEWPSDGHNGGAMAFGHDGMLFVTSGDGTSDSDRDVVGQDLSKLTAKVLRLDVDHPDPDRAYSVPKDNPFAGVAGVRPETWAYGLRNPWRMTVDGKTGHLWVGNNGQDLWETAYLIRKGANYGWSVVEGSHPFYPNRRAGPTPISAPTVEHHHSESRSLTGGIVYYGSRHPELRGAYLYGDYSTGKVWGVRHDGTKVTWHQELADTHLQITGFGTDARGEILIADHRGESKGGFYTLDPTPKDPPRTDFPTKLSASGLFRSAKGHIVEPALIPYSVNAPFWSDGAFKERYLALPGADSRIDFTRSRGWNFPDGTVVVKSFALDLETGNPASRRYVETRFLTKQDGEWFGYSYAWNDAQTDGELVNAKGADSTFTVTDARGGRREQTWHYPSRAECMVCHSRAANFVLGLSTLQMNKEHTYGPVTDNQLRTLEHLGLFRVDWPGEAREVLRESVKARGRTDAQADAEVGRQTPLKDQRAAVAASLLALPPKKYARLTDPSDAKAGLTARARSYLHANCSQCHVEAGGGNAQMELELTTPVEKMRVLDVRPQHNTYALDEARLIAPGRPERSVLLHRVSHRGEGHMPPLSTSVVDEAGVRLLREWVQGMKGEAPGR
jgi:glucose/arabinose dehydrogenase/mono/diheme cytochrome c family protein